MQNTMGKLLLVEVVPHLPYLLRDRRHTAPPRPISGIWHRRHIAFQCLQRLRPADHGEGADGRSVFILGMSFVVSKVWHGGLANGGNVPRILHGLRGEEIAALLDGCLLRPWRKPAVVGGFERRQRQQLSAANFVVVQPAAEGEDLLVKRPPLVVGGHAGGHHQRNHPAPCRIVDALVERRNLAPLRQSQRGEVFLQGAMDEFDLLIDHRIPDDVAPFDVVVANLRRIDLIQPQQSEGIDQLFIELVGLGRTFAILKHPERQITQNLLAIVGAFQLLVGRG